MHCTEEVGISFCPLKLIWKVGFVCFLTFAYLKDHRHPHFLPQEDKRLGTGSRPVFGAARLSESVTELPLFTPLRTDSRESPLSVEVVAQTICVSSPWSSGQEEVKWQLAYETIHFTVLAEGFLV